MFGFVKIAVFLVNICLMVQVALSLGDDPADGQSPIPNPETINPALPNHEQLLQGSHVQPSLNDIQLNRDAFAALPNHFGNIGPLLYDAVTNENALGEEFAKVSRIIVSYVNFDQYRRSLSTIMELADRIDFSAKMSPLFAKIADIQDPKGEQTLGQAVEILLNISRDENVVDEIRKRITSPNPVTKS